MHVIIAVTNISSYRLAALTHRHVKDNENSPPYTTATRGVQMIGTPG